MSYTKHNFEDGQVLTAAALNAMDGQIAENESIAQGKYTKPSGGIPKTDLVSAVQTSLGRADKLTDEYINNLIDAKLGVIENGTY